MATRREDARVRVESRRFQTLRSVCRPTRWHRFESAHANAGVDETEPQWSPKRFTLREGDGSPLVPDRSSAAISGSELRLIQKLAGRADALEEYSNHSSRPTFGAKISARFYKLLATASSGQGDSGLITLRDDGTHRRALNAGMPGFYSSPRFDPSGRAMAFLRRQSGSGALYFAAFPVESELLDDKVHSL